MCGSGFFWDLIILVFGVMGIGKILMVMEFMDGGVVNGECCLVFVFEES